MTKETAKLVTTNDFDIVHVEHIRGGHFLPVKRNVPAVYDSVDCIAALYKQFAEDKPSIVGRTISWMEWKKLCVYEPKVVSRFDEVIVTSRKDKEELERLLRRSSGDASENPKIKVLANGVDLEYFQPRDVEIEPNSILFAGKMSYYANEAAVLHFYHHIFPEIRDERPEVKLYIVGKNPSKEIWDLTKDENVVVTGYVPDIRNYISKAEVVVCPVVVGAGIQNKVLEAMAMARPVIATSKACSALDVKDGENILIADDSTSFARRVIKLLDDEALRRKIGFSGRKYVESKHDWRAVVEELEKIYREVQSVSSICKK